MAIPDRLQQLPQPPLRLYQQGTRLEELLQQPCVAVVGSRKLTPYGKQVTYELASGLAKLGVVIISGLAFGIDSVAHQAALDNGTPTIAVLPSPLDHIYPASHAQLAQAIVESGGTLLTEYDLPPKGFKECFIARNRIIAGLADGVLITEAAERSGSLHTAQFALELGKPVMAVPGPINSPTSAGTNSLIKGGAASITGLEDILYELGMAGTAPVKARSNDPHSQRLLDSLEQGIHAEDELLMSSGLTADEFNRSLIMLEIDGTIHSVGNNRWTLG